MILRFLTWSKLILKHQKRLWRKDGWRSEELHRYLAVVLAKCLNAKIPILGTAKNSQIAKTHSLTTFKPTNWIHTKNSTQKKALNFFFVTFSSSDCTNTTKIETELRNLMENSNRMMIAPRYNCFGFSYLNFCSSELCIRYYISLTFFCCVCRFFFYFDRFGLKCLGSWTTTLWLIYGDRLRPKAHISKAQINKQKTNIQRCRVMLRFWVYDINQRP